MDFSYSPKVEELRGRLLEFMDGFVYPAEPVYEQQMRESGDPHHHPQVIEDLKREARSRGLWNLFLPDPVDGAGLSVQEYAPLAEITGRSPEIAPEALNCSAPGCCPCPADIDGNCVVGFFELNVVLANWGECP